MADGRLRRDLRSGKRGRHHAGRAGIRHQEAGREGSRVEVGPGREGHRRRSENQGSGQGTRTAGARVRRAAQSFQSRCDRGFQERRLPRVRAALAAMGEYIPPIALAGGFTFEDQIFKGFALCAPYVKLIAWARSPLAAAMVAKNIGKAVEAQTLPIYVERFGTTVDEIFVTSTE